MQSQFGKCYYSFNCSFCCLWQVCIYACL